MPSGFPRGGLQYFPFVSVYGAFGKASDEWQHACGRDKKDLSMSKKQAVKYVLYDDFTPVGLYSHVLLQLAGKQWGFH